MSSCLLSSFEGLSVLSPRSHGLLDVHPIVSDHPTGPVYRTLDDALASGRFHVEECEEATVPELIVINDLDEPVLIIDGEILVGGRQDRAVNTTVLVPAKSRLGVPVSCVEARRWGGGRRFQRSDGVLFSRSRSSRARAVSESLRSGHGYRSDQARLWNEVRARIDEVGCAAPTDSVTRAAAARGAELDEYVAALAAVPGQVGAVFVIAGKVVGVEVAPSPAVYATVHGKLVKSVAMDALAVAGSGEPCVAEPESVEEFLAEVSSARREEHPAVGLGEASRIEGERLTGARLEHDGALVHCVAFRLEDRPELDPDWDPAWDRPHRRDRTSERVEQVLGRPQHGRRGTAPHMRERHNWLQHWLLEHQDRLEWSAGAACNRAGIDQRVADDVADEVFLSLWHEALEHDGATVAPGALINERCQQAAEARAREAYRELIEESEPLCADLPDVELSLSDGQTLFVHVVTISALAHALDALRDGQSVALGSRAEQGAWQCVWPTDGVLIACPLDGEVLVHLVTSVAGFEGGDPCVSGSNVARTSAILRARSVRLALGGRYAVGPLHRITRDDLAVVREALA